MIDLWRYRGCAWVVSLRSVVGRRRSASGPAIVPERTCAAADDGGGSLGSLIVRILDGLPEEYRLPVWLRHYEGMSRAEVAVVVSLPERIVGDRIDEGLRWIGRYLAELGVALGAESIVRALRQNPAVKAPPRVMETIGRLVSGI